MRTKRAFTLVELLVVIGIIAVLIGILMPALSRANRQAKMTNCLSNQKQLIMALLMYCQENKGYFPGGPGVYKWKDANGVQQPPTYRSWTAMYNPDAYNPYACNSDENLGPTFLAKYVSNSKQLPACPEEPFVRARGSFFDPNNLEATSWTSYFYPMSIVYTPEEIWNAATTQAGINNGTLVQKPQKITRVKYPTEKVVIIDRKTYHDKKVMKTNETSSGVHNDKKEKTYVTAGFADGHAAYRGVWEMYDADVNWTGRFNINDPSTYTKGKAGVLWKDFK